MSRPEICAEEIGAILSSGSINFRPGSTEIDPASRGVIAAIADVLRTCPGGEFEVAGHTDSQGRPEVNERLSTDRADAVREALEAQDLPLITFRARGYGARYPVADNESPDGRRANRRIELTLFKDAPEPDGPVARGDGAGAAGLLDPESCASEVTELLGDEQIAFASGASTISAESESVIGDLAETLKSCAPAAFEIGGHTDSIGRADLNQRISAERAEAVRAALEAAGVPDTVTLSSRGYGSENPVADNGTSEGRAANRRIELKLLAAAARENDTQDSEAGTGDGSE